MVKETGIGMTVTVDDSSPSAQAITNDVTNVSFGIPRNLQDTSGLDVASMERLALLGDGNVDINGVFNDGLSHLVFKDINTSNQLRTVAIPISGQTLTLESYFTDYTLTRAADGALTFAAPGQLAATASYGWS